MTTTALQAKALEFIDTTIPTTGVAPSYKEIGAHLELKSSSNVKRIIDCLIERGRLRRLDGKARSIEVIRHIVCPNCGETITSTGEKVSHQASAA